MKNFKLLKLLGVTIIILSVLTALGYLYFFRYAPELQSNALEAFSGENIKLGEPGQTLRAKFVGISQQTDVPLLVSLSNTSEFDYEITLSGVIRRGDAELAVIANQPTMSLPAKTSRDVTLNIPLNYGEESAAAHLNLTTEIKTSPFLDSESREITGVFAILTELMPETDIIGLGVKHSFESPLVYKPDQTPAPILSYSLDFVNKTSQEVVGGLWEIELTDLEGNKVQPLEVQQQALEGKQNMVIEGGFDLNLPPADQLQPGSKDYRLRMKYQGVISGRLFQIETLSEEAFSINVTSI